MFVLFNSMIWVQNMMFNLLIDKNDTKKKKKKTQPHTKSYFTICQQNVTKVKFIKSPENDFYILGTFHWSWFQIVSNPDSTLGI